MKQKKILKKSGFICEDTDEYDDADLGLDVNPKEYHKQKAKRLSWTDRDDTPMTFLPSQDHIKLVIPQPSVKIQLLRNVIRKNF